MKIIVTNLVCACVPVYVCVACLDNMLNGSRDQQFINKNVIADIAALTYMHNDN